LQFLSDKLINKKTRLEDKSIINYRLVKKRHNDPLGLTIAKKSNDLLRVWDSNPGPSDLEGNDAKVLTFPC